MILRQATDAEFDRYAPHAQMKLRGPMRQGAHRRAGCGAHSGTHNGVRPKAGCGGCTADCSAAGTCTASAIGAYAAAKKAVEGRPTIAGEPIGWKMSHKTGRN